MQSALSTPECGPTTTSDTFVSTVHRTSFKFYQNKPNFSNISELKQKASAWNYLNMTQSYLFIYLTSKNFCGRILVYNGVEIQNTLDAFSMSESQTGQKQFSIKNIHLQQLIFKSIYNQIWCDERRGIWTALVAVKSLSLRPFADYLSRIKCTVRKWHCT